MVPLLSTTLLFSAAQGQEESRRLQPSYIRGPWDSNLPGGAITPQFVDAQAARRLDSCVPDQTHETSYTMLKWRNTELSAITFNTPGFEAKNPEYMAVSNKALSFMESVYGSYGLLRVFYLEPEGETSAYIDTMTNWCEWTGFSEGASCAEKGEYSPIAIAKAGNGSWYISSAQDCVCGKRAITGAGMILAPQKNSAPEVATMRAVHEYFHVYQLAAGVSTFPGWIGEGAAVLNECIFAKHFSNKTNAAGQAYSNQQTYKDCLYSGGGSSGIIPNAYALFESNPTLFEEHGEYRDGNENAPQGDMYRKVYYDAGAFAIVFAANNSNKSVMDFMLNYFPTVEPVPTGLGDMANPLSDSEGWKKAFLAWSGFRTTQQFYSEFKKFMTEGTKQEGVYSIDSIVESQDTLDDAITAAIGRYDAPPLVTVPTSGFPYVAKAPTCDGEAPVFQDTPADYGNGAFGNAAVSSVVGVAVLLCSVLLTAV